MNYDLPILIEPAGMPHFSIIWLHGLGADGNDFLPIVSELALPASLGVRFIFPHAAMMPVSINGGYVMRAWYDIAEADLTRQVDTTGISQSVDYLGKLIDAEVASGIPINRIIIAGFSQGGVVALSTAMQQSEELLGVMALSTYLPVRESMPVSGLQIFQAHGQDDTVIPLTVAKETKDYLLQSGQRVTWHEYPMAHSVCAEEIMDIREWLLQRLDQAEAP